MSLRQVFTDRGSYSFHNSSRRKVSVPQPAIKFNSETVFRLPILREFDNPTYIYSNKKETSDFHGTVSFDPAKMLQQK